MSTGPLPSPKPGFVPTRNPIPSGARVTHLLPAGRPAATLCGTRLGDRTYTTFSAASATCFSCRRIHDQQEDETQ